MDRNITTENLEGTRESFEGNVCPLMFRVRKEAVFDVSKNEFNTKIFSKDKSSNSLRQFCKNIICIRPGENGKGIKIYDYSPSDHAVYLYHSSLQMKDINKIVKEANDMMGKQSVCEERFYLPSFLRFYNYETRGKFYISDRFLETSAVSRSKNTSLTFRFIDSHDQEQKFELDKFPQSLVNEIYRYNAVDGDGRIIVKNLPDIYQQMADNL